jgi:hypothetical protein
MTNNTTNNETVVSDETGMIQSLLDTLIGSPELMFMAAIVIAMGTYILYTQPAIKGIVMAYLAKHDEEILKMLDVHLTTTQLKAFEKLDEAAQKYVKDKMLRNVILSAWDQNDDKFISAIKAEAKEALVEAKQL